VRPIPSFFDENTWRMLMLILDSIRRDALIHFDLDSTYYLDNRVGISGITSILLRGLICLFFNLFFKLTAAPFHL